MGRDDIEADFRRLRMLATNTIGFHDLAGHDGLGEARRLMYEAQAYANGLALALALTAMTADGTDPTDEPEGGPI